MLNHPLAPIPARQIEIDVGPLAALFGEEPLEQQVHADRIDGRDPEAVAHRAVRCRSASLHQDVFLTAVVDDVPDDEEVPGEIEPLDQIELALDLASRTIVIRPISLARARLRHLPQERRHRLAGRNRVVRKAVAEIRHGVFEPFGERAGTGDRLRQIAEQPRHRIGRLEIALRIPRQPTSCIRERGLVTDAGEDVVQRPIDRLRKANAVGGDDRQMERRREIDEGMIVGLFVPEQVTLQLDRDPAGAEHSHESIDEAADAKAAAVDRCPPDERHQPAHVAIQIVEREGALAFRRAQLHPRDEPAQVAIALTGRDEERKREKPALGVRRSAVEVRTNRHTGGLGETSGARQRP